MFVSNNYNHYSKTTNIKENNAGNFNGKIEVVENYPNTPKGCTAYRIDDVKVIFDASRKTQDNAKKVWERRAKIANIFKKIAIAGVVLGVIGTVIAGVVGGPIPALIGVAVVASLVGLAILFGKLESKANQNIKKWDQLTVDKVAEARVNATRSATRTEVCFDPSIQPYFDQTERNSLIQTEITSKQNIIRGKSAQVTIPKGNNNEEAKERAKKELMERGQLILDLKKLLEMQKKNGTSMNDSLIDLIKGIEKNASQSADQEIAKALRDQEESAKQVGEFFTTTTQGFGNIVQEVDKDKVNGAVNGAVVKGTGALFGTLASKLASIKPSKAQLEEAKDNLKLKNMGEKIGEVIAKL